MDRKTLLSSTIRVISPVRCAIKLYHLIKYCGIISIEQKYHMLDVQEAKLIT